MEALVKTAPVKTRASTSDHTVTVAGATLELVLSTAAPAAQTSVIHVVTQAEKIFFSATGATVSATTQSILSAQGFKGAAKQVAVAPGAEGVVDIFVGVGDVIDGVSTTAKAYVSANTLRNAIYAGINKAKELKLTSVTVALLSVPVSNTEATPLGAGAGIKAAKPAADAVATAVPIGTPASPASAAALVDLAARMVVTGNWRWDKYWKAEAAKEKNHPLASVTIAVDTAAAASPFHGVALSDLSGVFANAAATAESLLLTREFGNEQAEVLTTAAAAEVARTLAEAHPDVLKFRVLDHAELLANGYNMLSAVGQGATVPPCLAVLEYNGFSDSANSGAAGANADYIAFVGKGVVFDTGGLNLKPTGSIETMHLDKGGAAAVIGAMRALATVRPPVKVVGVLALAENAIDAKSFKPYAILESYAGSVQNMNTDAEGRLCLADALTFVQNEYKPTHVLNIATLTGHCCLALGEYAAGLFSNSNELATQLTKLGSKHAERLWRLPILPEHHVETTGEDADISSMGPRPAGASTAAAFLEKFIQPGVQWAHLDIAGTGMGLSVRGYIPKNATGFGMQTLFEFALARSAGAQ
jgi:leucyl aminopeptidase